jgi:dolichol-phosphate mannosyltransferase
MDADLQHDESILPELVRVLDVGRAGISIGSRKAQGGKVEDWGAWRRFVSWVATKMSHFALRHQVKDPMSGFFLITRKVYQAQKSRINPRGFKILLEFLARAKNVSVVEVGYTFRGRMYGESKLSSRVIVDYLKALYDLSPLGALIPTRFVKYGLVGVSGLIVSYLGLLLFYQGFGLSRAWSVAAAIELSIITNYVLNNAWTFREAQLKLPWAFFRGLITFQAICLSGALINQAMALWLNDPFFGLNLYVTNALGYVVAAVWNYVINVKVTWRQA